MSCLSRMETFLFHFLSTSPKANIKVTGYFFMCVCVCVCVCMYVLCMYVSPNAHTVCPLLLSFHPSAPPSIFVPTVRSSVCPFTLPSFHLSTHPQIHLPLRPPSYLLIQLPIYLFPGNLISSFRGIQCTIIASGGLYSVIRCTWTAVGFIHSNNRALLFYAQRFFIVSLCFAHSRYPSRHS
jgi:hypothetical protein